MFYSLYLIFYSIFCSLFYAIFIQYLFYKPISMKSTAPLVGTPKAVWLARNFVWWSRWEGEGKGLVGTYFFVVGVRIRVRIRVRVAAWCCINLFRSLKRLLYYHWMKKDQLWSNIPPRV